MELDILDVQDKKMTMVVSKTTPAVLNALRRTLLSNIPKMAINNVEFHMGSIMGDDEKEYESKTPLFDEIIAHRLGLVPIPSDIQAFKNQEDCDCEGEGCPQCTIMYTLNKKGPCTVYSGDLEPLGDASYSIRDPLIPIVKLDRDQAVLIYATAVQGDARKHVKWQVVCSVTCRYYPIITVNSKLCDQGGTCVKACPRDVLKQDKKGNIVVSDPNNCTLCEACSDACTPKGKPGTEKAITVEGDPTKFLFSFETDGSRTAKETLVMALDILEGRFNDFRDQVSAASGE